VRKEVKLTHKQTIYIAPKSTQITTHYCPGARTFEFVFFYHCLDLCSVFYIVAFITVLCIDLFSCEAASPLTINVLTYLLTYRSGLT